MQITITTPAGQILAKGEIGAEVVKAEGNYYFDKSIVNFELLKINPLEKYTCPVKRATCDYYDLLDPTSNDIEITEIGWIYEVIENPAFESIVGKIAFFQSKGLIIETEDN